MKTLNLKLHSDASYNGCFTLEHWVSGKTLTEIGRELGLPTDRLIKGAYIVWALEPPSMNNFELAGWAKYPTDLFVSYKKGTMQWNEKKFEETYKGKRMPISIAEAKDAWHWQMHKDKLVKVVPVIEHREDYQYPAGGHAPQILVIDKIRCQTAEFIPVGGVFRGIYKW